jgi:hypothetical protein
MALFLSDITLPAPNKWAIYQNIFASRELFIQEGPSALECQQI